MKSSKCEFCLKNFTPRPQVKTPRACSNCQRLRQRSNERDWHRRNQGLYDAKYHQSQRIQRHQYLKKCVEKIIRFCQAGSRLFEEPVSISSLKQIMLPFFIQLGVRAANKLWLSEKTIVYDNLC